MGNWSLVRPAVNTNLIENPSLELGTTGWSDSAANTIAQSSEQSNVGVYSLKCTYADSTSMANYDISLDAGTYLFYARVYLPSNWDGGAISISSTGFAVGVTVLKTMAATNTGTWVEIYSTQVLAGTDIGTMIVLTASAPTAGRYLYVDAGMILVASLLETYIDGDQPDCFWNGVPHASTSTRLQFSRRGGQVLDLTDNLYFATAQESGVGMVTLQNLTQPISQQGGSTYDGVQVKEREFTITGSFNAGQSTAATLLNYHSRKRTLLKALNPRTNMDVDDVPSPLLLRYSGGAEIKEISAYYSGGLEENQKGAFVNDPAAISFVAPDPYFYDVGRPAKILATTDSATFRLAARRVGLPQNITGDIWDNMDISAVTSGTAVYAFAEDDTYIYIGGSFLNLNGTAACDHIARWNKATRAWSALGSGADQAVYDLMIVGSYLYACGEFTAIGGVTCRGIGRWDGSVWTALGPPSSGAGVGTPAYAMASDPSGNIYVAGDFVNWDGIAAADHIAKWNGSAWSALDTGIDNIVYDIVWYDEYLYAVGAYTTAGGVSADSIARWNGVVWAAISTDAISGSVTSIVFDSGGNFYIGGGFASIGGDATLSQVARWNGQAYTSLDGGSASGIAWNLAIDNDGDLWASGTFTTMGTLSILGDSIAHWNGTSWAHLDINFVATAAGQAIYFARNGDMYIGTNSTGIGTATYAGKTTISYSGSSENYPTITIKRTGGTTARLMSIRNETTDAELTFDYALANGETINIELNPFTAVRLVSSFIGNVPGAILPGNDIGAFYLDPGNGDGAKDNIITCYVSTTGSPTITALIYYRNSYLSLD